MPGGMPITPHSTEGKKHIHIVKKLGTNYITLYASDDKSSESACDAIINARARMGLITHIISDPGSDYTSKLVARVNTFLGINHRMGMADRPEGNGIERDVAEVKRFLRAITNHHDLQWSKPRVMMSMLTV